MKASLGDIINLKVNLEHRSTKYAIVICINQKWCLYINSKNREMYRCFSIQSFQGSQHFVACNQIFSFKEADINAIKPSLTKEEIVGLINHIKSVKTLTSLQKETIEKNLSSLP